MAMDEAVNEAVRTVAIAELVRDDALQVRAKLDEATIRAYAGKYKAGVDMAPVKVAVVEGVPLVVDGWHRLAALESIGSPMAPAIVIEGITRADAEWMAAQANVAHGLPLKGKEVKNVFRAYIRARKHLKGRGKLKTYREIAEELGTGTSFNTVRRWMVQDYPDIAKRMGGQEDFKGKGGLKEVDSEAHYLGLATKALDQVVAAARGLTSEEARGVLITELEAAIGAVKAAGPWVPPPPSDGLDEF